MAVIALLVVLLVGQGLALPMPFSDTDNGLLLENNPQLDGQLPEASQTKKKEMPGLLKVTGNLDNNILEVLQNAPKCGFSNTKARRTYKWEKNTLSYRIENYTPDLRRSDVNKAINAAIRTWADVTPLKFRKVYYGTADIMISFRSGAHGDGNAFDGPGNTLAHAYFPGEGRGGDVHFDEDERWTMTSSDYNLYLVAAHEIGHALGLDHLSDPNALMNSYYSYKPGNPLSQSDIMSIQALYGGKRSF